MADPSIGAQTFLSMRGVIPYAGEVLEEITRPTVDGVAFLINSMRAEPAVVYTRTLCYSLGAADTAIDAYALMQSYLYTVVDELGNSRGSIIVLKYRPLLVFKTLPTNTIPSGVYAVLDSEWTLQDTTY